MHFSPNVMSFFVDKISQDKPEAFGKIVFFIIKYCLNQYFISPKWLFRCIFQKGCRVLDLD